jgi:hypothetical protein
MATLRIPQRVNQSANSCRSGVNVRNRRIGSGSLSAGTATKILPRQCQYRPRAAVVLAADSVGSASWACLLLHCHAWRPGRRNKKQTPLRDRGRYGRVITKLSASPDPCLSTGFASSTIVDAGCSCHQARRYQHLATVHEDSVGTPAPPGRFSFRHGPIRAGLREKMFSMVPGPLPEIVGCHLCIAPLRLQVAGAFERVEHHVVALMAGVFVQLIARLQLEWIT